MSQTNLVVRLVACLCAVVVSVFLGVEGRAQNAEGQTDTSSQEQESTVFRSGITLVTTCLLYTSPRQRERG